MTSDTDPNQPPAPALPAPNSESGTSIIPAAQAANPANAANPASAANLASVANAASAITQTPHKRSLADHFEAFFSRLTSRSVFWHRIGSLIWLPYAFRSGIKMQRVDDNSFSAILPFRRFNRNWYNAMAGAALLANSEIAGGTYIYGRCGGDYTVVCKKLSYDFLRPCFGPAIYRITPLGDLDALLATGNEFNISIELNVIQQIHKRGKERELRVGHCTAIFHVTPKWLHQRRADRRAGKPV